MGAEDQEVGCSLRRRNRIAAVQFLYLCGQREEVVFSARHFSDFCEMLGYPSEKFHFARTLAEGVLEHREAIDGRIAPHVRNWTLARIARVDLGILRVAVHELFFSAAVPPVVIIDEAIEVSKILSSSGSRAFINGLLDRIREDVHRPLRSASPPALPLILPHETTR